MHSVYRLCSPNPVESERLPNEAIPSSPASTATLEANDIDQAANGLGYDELGPMSDEYASGSADCVTGSDATNSVVANEEDGALEPADLLALLQGINFSDLLRIYDKLLADLPAEFVLAFSRITEQKLHVKRQWQGDCPTSRQKCALASGVHEYEFSHLEDARYDSARGWEFLVSWKPTWEPLKSLRGGAAVREAHEFVGL